MYRPQIKVIDCTVRDGGLMNKWQFDDTFKVPAHSKFSLKIKTLTDYCCSFIS